MSHAEDRANYKITFAVLAIGMTAYALLQSMVSPVLPTLMSEFHTGQNTVTWVLTAYLLAASIATPILGRVGDAFGKEKMLMAALAALAVGSVISAVAPSIGVMIIGRVVQGIGGGVIPLSFGIIRDEFPREKVPGAVGIMGALLAVGGGVGLVLAGPIVSALDFRWLFWIPGILVAAAGIAAFFFVPESPVRTPGRVSWSAAVVLSAWLVALLVGVSEAPEWGWLSVKVLGLIVVAVILAVLWVFIELRSENPLIDMRMMRLPAVWTTNVAALLVGVGMYSVFAFLPEFLQTPSSAGYGFGADITESGLLVLPMSVTMFIFGSLTGPLASRFGGRWVMVAGTGATFVSFVMFVFAHSSIWQILVEVAISGVGIGLAFSTMSSIIVDAVPAHQTGVASGMNANIRTIGGAVGAAVVGSVVTMHVQPSGFPTESGYTAGYAVLAGTALLAVAASALIPRLRHRTDAHSEEQRALAHPEMAMVAAGTVVGDESE